MDKPKDKTYLKALLKLLKISKNRIRLDECHDYYVPSKFGKIFTVGPYWYVYYSPGSIRKWNIAKQKLSWMYLQNDGDDEGIFRADFPPSSEQAENIRKLLKIRISKELTEEERALLKIKLKSPSQRGVSQSLVSLND